MLFILYVTQVIANPKKLLVEKHDTSSIFQLTTSCTRVSISDFEIKRENAKRTRNKRERERERDNKWTLEIKNKSGYRREATRWNGSGSGGEREKRREKQARGTDDWINLSRGNVIRGLFARAELPRRSF